MPRKPKHEPALSPAMQRLVQSSQQEQAELEAKTKMAATNQDLIALANELLTEMDEYKRLEAEYKSHKDRYDQIRTQELPDMMKALGMLDSKGKGSFTFAGGKIHLENKLSASCSSANQPELFDWLRTQGEGDLIKEVVHPSSLTAFVKERREQGLADPPGIAVWEATKAKLTATK